MAVGVITEFIYLILHGPKSCNIEYGLCLALLLVKSDMGLRLVWWLVMMWLLMPYMSLYFFPVGEKLIEP